MVFVRRDETCFGDSIPEAGQPLMTVVTRMTLLNLCTFYFRNQELDTFKLS